MRGISIIIAFVFFSIDSIAQESDKSSCSDTSRYRLNINSDSYSELEIKVRGEWKTFQLPEDFFSFSHYECQEIELNGTGSKELVLRWETSTRGTDYGSNIGGIQIWNLDNGTKLLDEINYCSEECMGKSEPSYFIACQKKIQIIDNAIIVHRKSCNAEWSEVDNVPDPTSYCSLSTLEEGTYYFENGNLKKK